jgi:hypothetical protein
MINKVSRPLSQETAQGIKTYKTPQKQQDANLSSIYLRSSKSNKLYVGITFDPSQVEGVRHALKKHRIQTPPNKNGGQYHTNNAARQIELVRLAMEEGVINKEQRNEILTSIALFVES